MLGEVIVDTNIHSSLPDDGEFLGLADGNYTLRFTDNQGCVTAEDLTLCYDCPDGFTGIVDGCVKYETAEVVAPDAFITLMAKTNIAYTNFGLLLFSSYNLDGTGTYEVVVNDYWVNSPVINVTDGAMNRSAVWATLYYDYQEIGFVFCIDVAVGKTYYVGFGCDNYGSIILNGETIISQNLTALRTMLGRSDDDVAFKYWYVYPVFIPAGNNVIEIHGHNIQLVCAVGAEIYDATAEDIRNAMSDADLGDKLLFRSRDLVGSPLQLEERGFGYLVPSGYSLVDCGGDVIARKKILIECGATYTTTTSTTSGFTTTTTTTILTEIISLNIRNAACPSSVSVNITPFLGASNWYWDFGDGVKGWLAQNAYYCYATSAIYTITMSASHDDWSPISSITVNRISGVLDLSFITEFPIAGGSISVNVNTYLTGITFAASVSGTLRSFQMTSAPGVAALDFSPFTISNSIYGNDFYIYGNVALASLTLPSGTGALRYFYAHGCALGYIDFTVIPNCLKLNSQIINLYDNNMSATEVNHLLVNFAALASGESSGGDYTGRSINIGGNNACPDYSSGGYNGIAAVDALRLKGFTVTVASGCTTTTTTSA